VRRWRRPGLPADVAARLDLSRGEHVIATARTMDGRWLIATSNSLLVTREDSPTQRLDWRRIIEATWRQGVLQIVTSTQGRPESFRWYLEDDPGLLPDAVHDRVTSSIVVNQHVRLRDRAGVRIIGRRVPDTDDLAWTLSFDRGLDPDDPQLRALADAELRELRQQLGT
jgi:hypothetical protein